MNVKMQNTLLNQVAKYAGDVRAKYQKVYQDAIADLSTFGEDNKAAEDALKAEMNAAITIALGDLAERTKELESVERLYLQQMGLATYNNRGIQWHFIQLMALMVRLIR